MAGAPLRAWSTPMAQKTEFRDAFITPTGSQVAQSCKQVKFDMLPVSTAVQNVSNHDCHYTKIRSLLCLGDNAAGCYILT